MSPQPALVGATERPFTLAGSPASTSVALAAPAGAAPSLVSLRLEDIDADRPGQTDYEVSIAVPGAAPRFVGTVSFPAVEAAARREFDITGPVADLRALRRWDDRRVTVAFRPVWTGAPAAGARSVPVRIGRVCVFYA